MRAARFVLRRARLDVPNDLHTNGESALQRWMLELAADAGPLRVLDVGANAGRWSGAMLAAARQAGRLGDLDLHAFEPSSYTYTHLARTLAGQPVRLQRAAASERAGHASLHVLAPGAGVNSLHEPSFPAAAATEEVATITIDSYADQLGLAQILLMKVDTEGHDLAVLRGARALLGEQRILAAQFEYNHRWISARSYLRDAFELLQPLGYRVGKLTPRGVEFYPGWDAELETFVEGNYVACVPAVADGLPRVAWWKSASKGVPRWQ